MKPYDCILSVKNALAEAKAFSNLIIGVSGGPDSVALLHMLRQIGVEGLAVAHLNHCIRGNSADGDAAFVRSLCEGITYYEKKIDVPALAKERGLTLEEAARDARYGFLREAKRECGASFILTAHHRDDQAETVLMHMLRGSALNGLCGMRLISGDIVRPMLKLSRADIMDYIEQNGIAYRTDETNLMPCCERNRIRLELMPELMRFNPHVAKNLSDMAELIERDERYLENAAHSALKRVRVDENVFRVSALKGLDIAIRGRAVRAILTDLGIPYDRHGIERILSLFEAQTGTSASLKNGMTARVSYDRLVIEKAHGHELAFETVLNTLGDTRTPKGVFNARLVSTYRTDDGKFVAYMDADKLPERVVVRQRLDGDRFWPLGAKGSRKLKSYLIDKKLPREERESFLLANGSDILFFPGTTIAHCVRISENTSRILRVEYTQI